MFALITLTNAVSQRDQLRVAGEAAGVVTGRIVADDKNASPVRRAVVTMRGTAARDRIAVADDDGRFAFTGLPLGNYIITVTKAAYVETAYGATATGGAGTPIAVSGDKPVDVTVRLPYGGAIEGRITSPANDPLPGLRVDVQRIAPEGELRGVGQGVETDDRGVYRIFGLPRGEYLVTAAMPLLSAMRDRNIDHPSSDRIDSILSKLGQRAIAASDALPLNNSSVPKSVTFAAVYYPGVSSADDATGLVLTLGEERANVDFVFEPVATASVTGSITGPIQNLTSVRLAIETASRRFGTASNQRTVQPKTDGTFAVSGVPPGHYRIVARASRGDATVNSARAPGGFASSSQAERRPTDVMYAAAEVDVQGSDISGIALVLEPGATIVGRVRAESNRQGQEFTPGIRIALSPIDNSHLPASVSGFAQIQEVQLRRDNTFALTDIGPGNYSLRVLLPPNMIAAGWWARSAAWQNVDLFDRDSEIRPGASIDGVDVVLSDRRTVVKGVLSLAATGQPVADYVIVAFSADRQHWRRRGRRTQIVRPATDGTFEIINLPAGDYLLAVTRSIDPNGPLTATFLESLASQSVRITLAEGEQRVQDLQISR
jgi:hypothetical protein